MPETLTSRQQEVLSCIEDSISSRGFPPTLREIGEHLGIKSTNGVNDHLKALTRKGFLRRNSMKSRGMCPTSVPQMVEVPLLGSVPAGVPMEAIEEEGESLRVDPFFIGSSRSVFALKVQGESMIEDGIHDGDYVFVAKEQSASKGDTVVAMIDGEATVKRFYPEGDRIRFQPANETMEPIYVERSQMVSTEILGIVVGVYRKVR